MDREVENTKVGKDDQVPEEIQVLALTEENRG